MVVSFIDGGPRENHVLSQVIDTLQGRIQDLKLGGRT
jgi:hypothetical protein